MNTIHIGLSGYSYKPWQGPGRLYPEKLKSTEFLRYYAGRYHTVELDGIWYRLPTEQMVRGWLDQTPSSFILTPKAHRQITHMHRLRPDALTFVQVMLDRLAPIVEQKRLGPILLQLPPNFRRDDDRLNAFLAHVPRTVRWAMEFRDQSWHAPDVEALLTHYGVSWVAADTDDSPAHIRDTADFWYVRLRRSDYNDGALREWAARFNEMRRRRKDCYVYCKHEDEGSPWVWADRLLALTAE
ncbi:MAG TPA: DUF72 domain-containing protein [Nitrospiraceae bacterium]|nr:DUF72 domain-containing protein [Nitrospiraceae bacterium]